MQKRLPRSVRTTTARRRPCRVAHGQSRRHNKSKSYRGGFLERFAIGGTMHRIAAVIGVFFACVPSANISAAETDGRAQMEYQYRSAMRRADAAYKSAHDRCRQSSAREECLRQAGEERDRSKMHARAQMRYAPERGVDRRELEYKAALDRCEPLRGPSRNACVNETNLFHGRY